jgi:hypothetical protein
VSGGTHDHGTLVLARSPLQGSHLLRPPLPVAFGSHASSSEDSAESSSHLVQPQSSIAGRLYRSTGLGSSRFARRYYGNPLCSSGYVRCFSSPGSPRTRKACGLLLPAGVAPFGLRWIVGCQHLPSAFRRVATSFIGPWRLGIHHVLFFDYVSRTSGSCFFVVRAVTSVQTSPALAAPVAPLIDLFKVRPVGSAGGAAGTRTPDLRRARAALSQLSYGPLCCPARPRGGRAWTRTRDLGLIRAAL